MRHRSIFTRAFTPNVNVGRLDIHSHAPIHLTCGDQPPSTARLSWSGLGPETSAQNSIATRG